MNSESKLRVDFGDETATIHLDREIDDALVNSAALALDELAGRYGYRKVELCMASPGGSLTSMEYLLSSLAEWERRGVAVNTRALTNAQSAAAVILSCGSERRAHPKSMLLYHEARQLDPGTATEGSTRDRRAALRHANDTLADRLAERASEIRTDDWTAHLENLRGARFGVDGDGALCTALFGLPRQMPVLVCVPGDEPWDGRWHILPQLPLATEPDADRDAVFDGVHAVLGRDEAWNFAFGGLVDTDGEPCVLADGILECCAAARDLRTEEGRRELESALLDQWASWDTTFIASNAEEYEELTGMNIKGAVRVMACPEPTLADVMGLVLRGARDRDDLRGRLRSLYRNLLGLDTHISPEAAKMLGLLDAVGDGPAFRRERDPAASAGPKARADIAAAPDALPVPEWVPLHARGVAWGDLCRHTMILGETGSGKSKSGVLPLLGAMIDAAGADGPPPVGCLLVIDPKGEIEQFLAKRAGCPKVNIHRLRADAGPDHRQIRINVMDGEDAMDGMDHLGRARAIWLKVASIIPRHPAGVLKGAMTGSKDPFWDRAAAEVATFFLAYTLLLVDARRGRVAGAGAPASSEAARIVAEAERDDTNVLRLAQRILLGSTANLHIDRAVRRDLENLGDAGRVLLDRLRSIGGSYLGEQRLASNVLASVSGVFLQISDDPVASTLFFGVEPGFGHLEMLDFSAAARTDKAAMDIFVYAPDRSGAETVIGRALKASYFSAVLDDPVRRRGLEGDRAGARCGYVADEFHRFVTADSAHGEQSFLDRCRSFGAFCVLASQSVAGIAHALSEFTDPSQASAAISVLLNNTATKLFFRSTDTETSARLRPLMQGGTWGTALERRPLSTLAPGECQAVLTDGRVVRARLGMAGPEPGRAVA
ncbi:MAG: ATP-dependent Clp protease proteolytic subunit [Gammaproteobacteria bacterium]|nr:ATP-dependent Clp protease proteolytic subunit [Gammaproteobacteria bacterium]